MIVGFFKQAIFLTTYPDYEDKRADLRQEDAAVDGCQSSLCLG